jgi:hypothetical protein
MCVCAMELTSLRELPTELSGSARHCLNQQQIFQGASLELSPDRE